MSKQPTEIFSEMVQDFGIRSLNNRFGTLGLSTMTLLQSFIDEGDDYATAKLKTQELSKEITSISGGAKMDYILGDCALLIATVQASTLPQMTQAKKDLVNNILLTGE